MSIIKLPPKLQPIKIFLNQGVRKVSTFLAKFFTTVSEGPNVFYKTETDGPDDGGPANGSDA